MAPHMHHIDIFISCYSFEEEEEKRKMSASRDNFLMQAPIYIVLSDHTSKQF